MEDDERRILNDVFGDSSSSEAEYEYEYQDDRSSNYATAENPGWSWEQIKEVKGLWLCTNFLSPHHQLSLLLAIHKEGWFAEASHNQAMKFGDLPAWATELSSCIRKAVCMCGDMETYFSNNEEAFPLPSNIIWREPLFDQLIVNAYQPGEGICAHVDLMHFEDGIAIVSLESSCVMHFTKVETECSAEEPKKKTAASRIPVFLNPGSLVLMNGEARYLWKHEINRKPGFQVWEGKEIDQQKRISVTLRKLCRPL